MLARRLAYQASITPPSFAFLQLVFRDTLRLHMEVLFLPLVPLVLILVSLSGNCSGGINEAGYEGNCLFHTQLVLRFAASRHRSAI